MIKKREFNFSKYVRDDLVFDQEHPQNKRHREHIDYIIKKIPKDAEKILDVGCGTGYSTEKIRQKGHDVIGITISKKEVEIAKKRYPHLKIYQMDMHCLQFQDKYFDLVFARMVLEHSVAPYIAICEFNRVLKDNKFLLLINPHMKTLENPWHLFIPNCEQTIELLNKTGFKLLYMEYYLSEFSYLAKKEKHIGI